MPTFLIVSYESEDILETLPDDVYESDLDKLLEKVINSSTNILI